MKVLHIIPSAFEYFDDIRSESFELLEEEGDLGLESDAISVSYGGVTRKEKIEVINTAPSRRYLGQEDFKKTIEAWDYYDVINLHCPFLGELGTILRWVKDHPEKCFIITYHHDFVTPDFFGYLIILYNYYYLPRLFDLAKAVVFFSERRNLSTTGIKMLKNRDKIAVLGLPAETGDIHKFSIAEDLVIVYNSLMFK